MKIETLAVHAGAETDPQTGAVTPPIHLSTTFERAQDGSYPNGYIYGRSGNPTRAALESCLVQLEGAAAAAAFRQALRRPRPCSSLSPRAIMSSRPRMSTTARLDCCAISSPGGAWSQPSWT